MKNYFQTNELLETRLILKHHTRNLLILVSLYLTKKPQTIHNYTRVNANVKFPRNWFNIVNSKLSCAIVTKTQEKLSPSFDSEPKFSLIQESSALFLRILKFTELLIFLPLDKSSLCLCKTDSNDKSQIPQQSLHLFHSLCCLQWAPFPSSRILPH